MPPYDGYQSKRLQVRASFFLAFNQKQGDPGFVRIIYIYIVLNVLTASSFNVFYVTLERPVSRAHSLLDIISRKKKKNECPKYYPYRSPSPNFERNVVRSTALRYPPLPYDTRPTHSKPAYSRTVRAGWNFLSDKPEYQAPRNNKIDVQQSRFNLSRTNSIAAERGSLLCTGSGHRQTPPLRTRVASQLNTRDHHPGKWLFPNSTQNFPGIFQETGFPTQHGTNFFQEKGFPTKHGIINFQ